MATQTREILCYSPPIYLSSWGGARAHCINYCFGNMKSSQESLTTIVYVKFGGQKRCIMGILKIENMKGVVFESSRFTDCGKVKEE